MLSCNGKQTMERKDIMIIKEKEKAFQEIMKHTDWSDHRKAAERHSWRRKHEPNAITRCPNRGKRYKKKVVSPPIPVEEDDPPCYICKKSSDGYDFPCGHPICHPCFQKEFLLQEEGKMTCGICKKEFTFYDELVDD